jgi:hypothetical protein
MENNSVPIIVEHRLEEEPSANDDMLDEDDLVSGEVQLIQVKPEQGQFEIISTDSDDKTSSESGTPLQQRLRMLPPDARSSSTPSPRVHSPGGSDVIVYGADQWKQNRREVLEACKPRPSGWLWMEGQTSDADTKHSEEISSAGLRACQTASVEYNGQGIDGTPNVSGEFSARRGSSHQAKQAQTNIEVSHKTDNTIRMMSSTGMNSGGQSPTVQATNRSSPRASFNVPVQIQSENFTASVHSTAKSSEHPRSVSAVPKPPPRGDSVKSYEMIKSSKSYELHTSANVVSSRESSQFVRSQHFTDPYQFQQPPNVRPEETRCPTSYRVQVEDSRLPGDGYKSLLGQQRNTADSIRQISSSEYTEPAAVDALFTYHQMPSTTAVTPTSSLSARCNPAAKSPQGGSPTPPTSTTLRTHF